MCIPLHDRQPIGKQMEIDVQKVTRKAYKAVDQNKSIVLKMLLGKFKQGSLMLCQSTQ